MFTQSDVLQAKRILDANPQVRAATFNVYKLHGSASPSDLQTFRASFPTPETRKAALAIVQHQATVTPAAVSAVQAKFMTPEGSDLLRTFMQGTGTPGTPGTAGTAGTGSSFGPSSGIPGQKNLSHATLLKLMKKPKKAGFWSEVGSDLKGAWGRFYKLFGDFSPVALDLLAFWFLDTLHSWTTNAETPSVLNLAFADMITMAQTNLLQYRQSKVQAEQARILASMSDGKGPSAEKLKALSAVVARQISVHLNGRALAQRTAEKFCAQDKNKAECIRYTLPGLLHRFGVPSDQPYGLGGGFGMGMGMGMGMGGGFGFGSPWRPAATESVSEGKKDSDESKDTSAAAAAPEAAPKGGVSHLRHAPILSIGDPRLVPLFMQHIKQV